MKALEATVVTMSARKEKTEKFLQRVYQTIRHSSKEGIYIAVLTADPGVSVRSAANLLRLEGYKASYKTVPWPMIGCAPELREELTVSWKP
jgi:hypothetical protein